MHAKVESKGNNIFSLEFTKTNHPILIRETIALLTVLFTDLVSLNQPKLPPSPGGRAGQTYASADDPSASWHRVGGAVMHKKAGPHLLLTPKMLLSPSPTPALMSYN